MSVSVPEIQLFLLALTRVIAILSSIPILGGRVIPQQTRLVFSILLTLTILPWQTTTTDMETLGLFPLVWSIGQELIIGITADFAATLTFAAIQITGEMIGFSTGFNSGRVLNPAFGESSSTLDQFLIMLALLYLLATNGHHLFLLAIVRTFKAVPLNTAITQLPFETIITMTSELINTGIQLSLPAVGALIMADITLGLFAKVAPQVQVFFLGVPFKVALGLLAVSITISQYYPTIIDLLENIGLRMLSLLGV